MNAISKSRSQRAKKMSRSKAPAKDALAPVPWHAFLSGAVLWMVQLALLHGGAGTKLSTLALGQRAPSSVVASVDFTCEEVAKTDLLRRQAADGVLPVFNVQESPLASALRSIDGLIDQLELARRVAEAATPPPPAEPAPGGEANSPPPAAASPSHELDWIPAGQEDAVREAIRQALTQVWNRGVIRREDRENAFRDVAFYGQITLAARPGTASSVRTVSQIPTPDEAVTEVVRTAIRQASPLALSSTGLSALVRPHIQPNLLYDGAGTEALRTQAAKAVGPVEMKVRAGTTLVEAGERISPQINELLRRHEERVASLVSPSDRHMKIAGQAGLLLVMLGVCGALIQLFSPNLLRTAKHHVILTLLAIIALLITRLLLYLSTGIRIINPSVLIFLLPVSLAPMMAAMLLNRFGALIVGIGTSFSIAVLLGENFIVFSMGLVVTAVAIQAMRDVRKRTRILRAGLWVGLAQLLFVICLALWNQHTGPVVLMQGLAALAAGFLCSLTVLLLIPFFELPFGITTDMHLLELSDMGHPLLQRLAMEAPGSYHHSLVVANLAQAAAAEIGANALLARVCAYYHDIGKLTKPSYFTENSQYIENPHDELSPSMSTLVIIAHVKEGIGLARQYKLPRPIIEGIQQHHGTTLVSFFYQRARQRQLDDTVATTGTPHEGDFRYPGPRPSRPEMAILMLADSAEAASRAMEKPTPVRLRSMVEDIIDARIKDGQLDECSLTLADLARIRESLIFNLTNMLHARTPYPADENRNPQPPAPPPQPSEPAAL